MIPLARPPINEADLDAVRKVLASRMVVQGPEVAAFESELAALLDVSHVVVVSSGTAALHIALAAYGIGRGDLVAVPAYSWIATANVVETLGAHPIFIDVEERSYNIDPSALRKTIQDLTAVERKALKAIIPVHAFGLMAEMDDVMEVSTTLGIPVIEDAACALGAKIGERSAGAIGEVGCVSFHALKVLTTGEGGALMTNDPEVAAFARAFRDHGQVRDRGLRRFVLPGLNLRMTDFQAALGRSQLNRLDSLLATRRNLFETYLKLLEGVDVGLPHYESTRTAAQSFVIRVPVDVERDKLVESMAQEGVQTGSGTIAMPFSEYFAGAGYADYRHLSVTASVAARALSLPLYHELATSDQRIVVAALVRCIDKLRGTTSGR